MGSNNVGEHQYYEKIAKEHNNIQAVMHSPILLARYRDFLERIVLKRYLESGNKSVLDIGCGNGRFFELFSSRGYNVTGVDFSKNLINQAKKRYPWAKAIVTKSEGLPFKDNSFDYVFLLLLLSHTDYNSFKKTIREAGRVVKNSGKIFILDEPETYGSVWDKEKLNSEFKNHEIKLVNSKFVRMDTASRIFSSFSPKKSIVQINREKLPEIKSNNIKSLVRIAFDMVFDLPLIILRVGKVGFEQLLIYKKSAK